MAEFFGSVLFTRILIAVFMVSVVALVGIGIGSIIGKKKNKQKTKTLSNTQKEKLVKTEEREEEQEVEEEIAKEELSNVTEFEHNGVKYVKYQYGASETVCKGENSAKWITFAQSLQNTGKLEKSKGVINSTLVINNKDILECFITGEKEELTLIQQNNLKEYNTEIKDINNQQEKQQEEVKEAGV